ncbi:MAG: Gfo/Idh/MocA family oxidoreductase [Marinoscillum sp.]
MINLKSRRGFIKLGALGTAATVLPFSQLTGNAKKEELVRVGVIGTGNRGMGLIDLINSIDGLEVVACADVIPFRLEVGLAQAEKAKGYTNHADLLGDKNVDAVLICTPFSMHGQMAIDALQAGKHVYCEKTMVKGVPEIQAVIDQYRKSDLVFQTGHQYHSSALYNKTRQIIQSGYIGDVTAIHCQWNRNGSWRRPVPDPKWERMINWRMYLEYSGGLVAELMSHQIDFINWVTQSLPSHFTGFGGIDHWKDGRETYDNVHLLMKYPSGLDASLTCTTTNGYDDYKIKILGSRATIIMDYANELSTWKKWVRRK